MRAVCLSDTHGFVVPVPAGDVLVFAGDCCNYGTLDELSVFCRWMATLPHRHKIVVAGNHDWPFERTPHLAVPMVEAAGAHYLQDRAMEIDGVVFYGSPWQPEFCGWAFNVPRGPSLARIWNKIPPEVNVLITHGPPMGTLDVNPYGQHVGCSDLRDRMDGLFVDLHVFGHIHGGAGVAYDGDRTYVNASICDEGYNPVGVPFVVEVPTTSKYGLEG